MPQARRVLVAGGTSTIGSAVVRRLCGCGDHVLFTGRRDDKAQAITAASGAVFVHCDALDGNAIDRLVEQARQMFGGLDGLVVAIGALHVARLSETTDEAWDAIVDANVVAPFRLARACFALFGEQGGAIVTIGSATAQWPELELGAYSASKRALEHLTRMLAVEGAIRGIRANCVLPGEALTAMSTVVGPPARQIGDTAPPPLGRRMQPDDVAAAVDFLLAEEAAFCTGASLMIDGGLRAALRASSVRK